jgi:peptidoglycan hydrolase-like protein with peptidoglycan-binding domain
VTSVLHLPGIDRVGPDFLYTLGQIADRNSFNVDGIATVISHESGFRPNAKNPLGSATGLIQFIESTAHALGTTTAALAQMTATQQLHYVEKFFAETLGHIRPNHPEDYILPTYGRVDAVGKPDDFVLDRRDSADPNEQRRYHDNASLDLEKKGTITAGDLRRSMRSVIAAARGQRIPIPLAPPPVDPGPPPSPSSPSAWVLTPSDVVGVNHAPGGAKLARLERGVSGGQVVVWQMLINLDLAPTPPLEPSGQYEADTETLTKVWQGKNGLKSDGIVGPLSWARMLV